MSVAVGPRMRHHLAAARPIGPPRNPTIYLCEHCLAPVVLTAHTPRNFAHGVDDWLACNKHSVNPLPTLNHNKATQDRFDLVLQEADWAWERDALLTEIEEARARGDYYMHYLDLVNSGQTLTSDQWDEVDGRLREEHGSESERIWGAF